MKTILELRVSDRPGVLDRVVSLIRRRGWNISSMTAGDMGGGMTQITLRLEGRDLDLSPLEDYLSEMDTVRHWQTLEEATHVLREMLLFYLPEAQPLPAPADALRVVHEHDGMRYLEYTGVPSCVDVLSGTLQALGIPYVRSGPLPFFRGDEEVRGDG